MSPKNLLFAQILGIAFMQEDGRRRKSGNIARRINRLKHR